MLTSRRWVFKTKRCSETRIHNRLHFTKPVIRLEIEPNLRPASHNIAPPIEPINEKFSASPLQLAAARTVAALDP